MDWITDILSGPLYALGRYYWNYFMDLVKSILTMTPSEYAPEAWGYITSVLYPWLLSIGTLMLNLFFFIGVFKQASNLKQNFTLEVFVETGIKLLLANGFMVSGIPIMNTFFEMSAAMIRFINAGSDYSLRVTQQEIDAGMVLFLWLFGFIYMIVSVVCGIMILLAVYGRYIQLYLLVAVNPIALSTAVGGSGISHTAFAWIKTFLSKVFEIVLIALVLVVASKISVQMEFLNEDGFGDWFDGASLALQNIVLMIVTTAAVKGVDGFMRRALGL